MVDNAKLHQFMGQMLSDLGGAASVALVRIGDALGLYKTLHERGPMTVAEFAAVSGINQRYLREWLSHQAASNYLSYDPATQKFALPPEQAMVFAIEDSPVYMMGAFDLMTWITESKDQVQAVFPTGGGVPWSDHTSCFFCAVARFFRPGYHNNLVEQLAPCARRRRQQAAAWRQGRRCRVRARMVHRADGQGLSQFAICRLRLPPELDRTRSSPCSGARGDRKHSL